jgi:hypothetical protein
VCLSFCGTTKKPRSLEPGGRWDLSFIHPCTHDKFVVFLTATAEMWFCFFSVASFWIWSLELWFLVFFSFRVRFFGSHLQQIRANQGNVDTSTRSCRCLDAAALIRSWGTWRRRKRWGQTDRDREAKGVDCELLFWTPPSPSRGIRKQFLRSDSVEICGAATAMKLIKFSSNWDLAHRLHQQDHRHHLRYQLLRPTLGYLLTASHFTGFPTAPITSILFANPSPAASITYPLQPRYTFAGEEHHEASERQVMLWFTLWWRRSVARWQRALS